jgi:hypothetical protein
MLIPISRTWLFAAALTCATVLPGTALATETAAAAVTAVSVDQVRGQWASAKKAYLDSIATYAGQAQYAGLLQEYTAALEETGKALEAYIALKQTNPPVAPAVMTPAVDRLTKGLTQLKTLQGKATGNLITILGGALKQQQQITQNAIKNMR